MLYNLSMSFLENLENNIFPDEAGSEEILQEELPFNKDRLSLENIERYNKKIQTSYPEPWHRQTPKGYDPISAIKPSCNCKCSCQTTVNDLLESQTSFEE